jgi:hypothetical protein
VVVLTSENNPARVGTYTDTDITKRNVVETAAPSDLPPPQSPAISQGSTRPVYANDQAQEIANTDAATENAAVDPPPHAPNSWARGTVNGRKVSRDPYANQGMVGQAFFNNQSGG